MFHGIGTAAEASAELSSLQRRRATGETLICRPAVNPEKRRKLAISPGSRRASVKIRR
jgi:hypothetical protein